MIHTIFKMLFTKTAIHKSSVTKQNLTNKRYDLYISLNFNNLIVIENIITLVDGAIIRYALEKIVVIKP
jgi:hypothetical protein